MRKNISLILFMGCFTVAILVVQWYNTPKIAYVDLPRVFNGFEFKKEMESRLLSEFQAKNHIIDSMKLSLGKRNLSSEAEFQTVGYERQNIIQTAQAFEIDHEKKTKEFNEQIFNRLNEYVRQFANEKGYDFILGAEGSGVVLSADEKKDITDDVIAYINAKYQGK